MFADSSSLIGQKVQGLFSVEKSGSKVADAVVINGTAYAPVRAVSEATGAELSVEGKRIIIKEKEAKATVSEINVVADQRKQSQIEGRIKGIEDLKLTINKFESLLKTEQEKLNNAATSGDKETAQENIQELEIRIKQEKEALVNAEEKLAELQK